MTLVDVLLLWAPLSAVLLLLWLRQNKTQNANTADVAWAFGFCWASSILFMRGEPSLRAYLGLALVWLWALRLGGYLLLNRVVKETTEDGRYRRLREKLGWGPRQFFWVFQAQGVLVLAWSFALLPTFSSSKEFSVLDIVGAVWGVVCILGEMTADKQLSLFRSKPENKGTTCRSGLWKYSRHPNYFFEWSFWWSFVFFAVGAESFSLSLIGPVLMGLFLWKITGIPATERQAAQSRPDYKSYQRQSSCFFPWPPKK